jgi:iron complex outermembrane receptor protein
VAGSPYQSSATVRANCTANGVPANGSYAEPTGGQLAVLTGGNAHLKPETSETLLFGAVYAPGWARGSGYASQFGLEANYYDIKVSSAIAPTDAQLTLSRCALSADALSCAAITRTPNGLIQRINATLQNIGEIRTRGVDVTFNYRTPKTQIGYVGLSLNGNFLINYVETFPAAVGFTTTNYTGTTRGFPDQSYPGFKGTGVLNWALGDFDAAFTGRYIEHVLETSVMAGNRLGNTFYGDLRFSLTPAALKHKVEVTVGVNNLFNQNPPACYSCTGPNYDPTTYDVPGQFGYLRVTVRQ